MDPSTILQWRRQPWISSMKSGALDTDASLSKALKKKNYEAASHLLNALPVPRVCELLSTVIDVPKLINDIPVSLNIIDTLYTRIFISAPLTFCTELLFPYDTVKAIIGYYFSTLDSLRTPLSQIYDSQIVSILRVIGASSPDIISSLVAREQKVWNIVQGMGLHGLVESLTGFVHLHIAMRSQLIELNKRCKTCLQSMEDLGLITDVSVKSLENHQLLLKVNASEIQERLYKNKSFLNMLSPAFNEEFNSLVELYHLLEQRVDLDKEVLVLFKQLRQEVKMSPLGHIGEQLLAYVKCLRNAIAVMRMGSTNNSTASDNSLPASDRNDNGYASETSSNVSLMTSSECNNQTPILRSQRSLSTRIFTKRENWRKQISKESISLPIQNSDDCVRTSSFPENIERTELIARIQSLEYELEKSREAIQKHQLREDELVDRLSSHVQRHIEMGGSFENISDDLRPSQLIQRFGDLYSEARLDAMDALEDLDDLSSAPESDQLKQKILFSIVVLSFRSVASSIEDIKQQVSTLMLFPFNSESNVSPENDSSLASSFAQQLRRSARHRDTSPNFEHVSNQLWSTLFEFPSLRTCLPLTEFIRECVQLAWLLLTSIPSYQLHYHLKTFDSRYHQRFHMSDDSNDVIASYVWPSLIECSSGEPCVQRAVVIT